MLQLLAPEQVTFTSDAPGQHVQDNVRAIAPETLKKFRRGYGEEAELVATQLKGIAVTSAERVLRQAKLLLKLKERLNRKEWGVWLQEVLGWYGKEVAPYLQIAKTFSKFDPAVFRELEPFTLLKIRTKRYAPLVVRLQEEINITSELIQNFISEVIPKPSRRKKAAPNYGEAVLKQRLNPDDGTFYFSLNANLSDKHGSWLEDKLENCTVGQVLEQAAALEKQVEERRDDIRSGIEAQIEQRVRNLVEMSEFTLKQEIADLRAQLQNAAEATVVGKKAIATTDAVDDKASAEVASVAACTTVGEKALATTNNLDDEASTSGIAQAAGTTVGEKALATLKADDSASDEVGAVAASTTVGEKAIAKSDVLDHEPSAEALFEPISATVGEFDEVTLKENDDSASAEAASVPTSIAQALEPEAAEPTDDSSGTTAQEPGDFSVVLFEPATATDDEEAQYPVKVTSLTDTDSDARGTQEQEITPPWKQLSQLREAEGFLQEIDGHINKFNSDLATEGLNRIVSNQFRDALKNRQKLRSTKIGQIMAVADDSGIIADYEALRSSGRVVLAPSYASALLRQAESWSEVEMVVGRERDQLLRAVKEWSVEEKAMLVQLLSSHLEAEANGLEKIDWIPNKLLSKVLSNFTFRLQRIKHSDNLVDEVEMEYLEGCKFVSVQNLGDRQEQWVFEFESKNIPMFDRERIEIEKF